jgi:DNA-binding NarL/FixJ family response regulator
MSLSVLLADDHDIIRYGMRLLLEDEPDINVLGEAGSGAALLALVAEERPNLVVVDLGMPGGGPDLISELASTYPDLRILVLSMYKDHARVLGALRAGACGYVLKAGQTEEILEAIREVAAGRRYLSPALAEQMVDSYVSGAPCPQAAQLEQLTAREREIIQKAAEGASSAEIAGALFISLRTVETHRSRAMKKLGLRNQVELARFFVSLEMSRPSDDP